MGAVGLTSGLVKLIGGMVFIWLLITFASTGAILGLAGSQGLIMLVIFLGVLWIITRAKWNKNWQ